MKIDSRNRILGITFFIVLLMVLSAFIMTKDARWNGDEVITYSMSNSYENGWMLSRGRVVEYLEDAVIGDSFLETMRGMVSFVKDLAINRKQAAYFSYPRPSECGWYTRDEMRDWFFVTDNEGFNYASIYLNAMGDDANSFLYYMLVHTVGSVFRSWSGTSWAGYLMNLLAAIGIIIVMWNIGTQLEFTNRTKVLTIGLFSTSLFCLEHITLSRAYMVSSLFHMLLILLHIKLMIHVKNNNVRAGRKVLWMMLPIYVVGYVTHYSILFFTFFLGISMFVWLLVQKNSLVRRYFLIGTLAIAMGIALDPVSVMGLLLKLGRASSNEAKVSIVSGLMRSFTEFWIPSRVALGITCGAVILFLLVLCYQAFVCRDAVGLGRNRTILFWSLIIGLEMIVIQGITGQDYFKALYPMIFLLVIGMIASVLQHQRFGWLRKDRIWNGVLVIVLVLVTLANTNTMINRKESEFKEVEQLRQIIGDLDESQAIFLRDYSSDHVYFPEVINFDRTLFLTVQEEIPNISEFQPITDDSMTLISATAQNITDQLLIQLEQLGYSNMLCYNEKDQVAVYRLYR